LVYVEKKGLPSAFLDRLIRLAAFQNPEFYSAQAMRFSTFAKPRVIACAEDLDHYIALPRGLLQELLELFESHGVAARCRTIALAVSPSRSRFTANFGRVRRRLRRRSLVLMTEFFARRQRSADGCSGAADCNTKRTRSSSFIGAI